MSIFKRASMSRNKVKMKKNNLKYASHRCLVLDKPQLSRARIGGNIDSGSLFPTQKNTRFFVHVLPKEANRTARCKICPPERNNIRKTDHLEHMQGVYNPSPTESGEWANKIPGSLRIARKKTASPMVRAKTATRSRTYLLFF
jgi:hypothetical protein